MDENKQNDQIQLFEDQKIRTAWDAEQEEWFFSVVDVVGALTDQPTPRGASTYWAVLKKRLKEEGADQLLTNCKQLKMTAADGKKRLTDVADTEQLLRIIQSIPSPKAEPFKLWLAQVGRERIEETIDPEQAIDRALETYLKKGYSEEWVHQRLLAIRIRNELTDEWQKRGVEKGREYAILTDEISRAWSGMTTRQYKRLKGLKAEKGEPAGQHERPGAGAEHAGRGLHHQHLPDGAARGSGGEPQGGPAGRPHRRQRPEGAGAGDRPARGDGGERPNSPAAGDRGGGGCGGAGGGERKQIAGTDRPAE